MNGFDGIRIDHAALGQGAQDLVGAARGIQARLDALEADLRPLAGGWTGQARDAYDVAKARWDRAIAETIALLQETGAHVDAANSEFRTTDQRLAQQF